MDILALSASEQRRLERLAVAAGRTPKAMLKHVLRDGFDYCEYVVGAVNQGVDDANAGKLVASSEVRRKTRQVVVRHVS